MLQKHSLGSYSVVSKCVINDSQHRGDQAFYGIGRIGGELPADPVGDNGVEGQAAVAQDPAHAVEGGGFHFKITDAMRSRAELNKPVHQVGLGKAHPQDPSLRAIETRAGNSYAMVKAVYKMFQQGGGPAGDIGIADLVVELGLGDKGLEEIIVFLIRLIAIKIHQVIDSQPMRRGDKSIYGNIGLQGARGADPEELKRRKPGLDGPRFKIDVGKRVQFIQYDIDIVGSDAGRDDGKPFFSKKSGMCNEFAVGRLMFNRIKMFAHLWNAAGIAYKDNRMGDLVGPEIEVVDGASLVKDQF